MKITETAIDGIYILTPRIFADARGYFFESWHQDTFHRAGLDYHWVQDNQSKSIYGTIRGIHYQAPPYAQAKLVRVLSGRILDIAVDLRTNSKTFGKHIALELSDENHLQLLIPRGFGHGFSVLSETAIVTYKCDNDYAPQSEGSVRFDDADLNIDWQIDSKKALLSEKDLKAPSFRTYQENPVFKV